MEHVNICPSAQIGQSHGGLIGFFQTVLKKASGHIWFERGEAKDRLAVFHRYQSYVTSVAARLLIVLGKVLCTYL